MAHNESHVCDVDLSPTRAKSHVAERRAAEPEPPQRGGDAHYALLCSVVPELLLFSSALQLYYSQRYILSRQSLNQSRL